MPQEATAVYGGNAGQVSVGEKEPIVDPRQDRGRRLALDKRIQHIRDQIWFVPSQSSTGGHIVNLKIANCTCDDFELRNNKCAHQWAAEFRQAGITELPPARVPRKTYPQNWPVYHHVSCREKTIVQRLLKGLCEGILTPPHPGRGPKPVALGDAVYGMVMRVYLRTSARNACPDIQMAADAGHIGRAPRANTVVDYYNKPELTPLLRTLIEESASPLACVESQYAIDSTGFSTSVYRRWYDAKYGRQRQEQGWRKAHAVVGTKTNIVTAVTVTESTANDCPELPVLLAATDRHHAIRELSADKAYLSHDNLVAVEAVGAVPYVPLKSNSRQGEGSSAWQRLWGLFMYRREEFLAHYHRRSNVESTFSGVKRKFGGSVRSRTPVAQTNEILCRFLCWNLSCLAHAMFELNLQPEFNFISVPEVEV